MSHEASEWAWSVPDLPSCARIVLLALAEHVGEGGQTCFPGQARLAVMCGVSERQLRNVLRELERRGLIVIEHRAGQGEGRLSNAYRLAMRDRPTVSESSQAPGARMSDSGDDVSGQPERGFRNCGSNSSQATGSAAPGNRKRASGNAAPKRRRQPEIQRRATGNPVQATGTPLPTNRKRESEEGIVRKKPRLKFCTFIRYCRRPGQYETACIRI